MYYFVTCVSDIQSRLKMVQGHKDLALIVRAIFFSESFIEYKESIKFH